MSHLSKEIFMRFVNKIISAKKETIEVLQNNTLCDLKLVERLAKNVRDPDPIRIPMSQMSQKYPITADMDKCKLYNVQLHLLMPAKKNRGNFLEEKPDNVFESDMRATGRVLCKKELADWWVSNSEIPDEDVEKTRAVLYKQCRQNARDFYSIYWSTCNVRFGSYEFGEETCPIED